MNENIRHRSTSAGTKTGDLMNLPHRVAQALREDGWFWRSTIIWGKKSPMPESISGWRWVRCRVKTSSQVALESNKHGLNHRDPTINKKPSYNDGFQLAKFASCPGCDKCTPNGGLILRRGKWRPTTAHEYVFMFSKGERYFCDGEAVQEAAITAGQKVKMADGWDTGPGGHGNFHRSGREKGKQNGAVQGETRNPRSVWMLSNEPYKGSHFATFPTKLVKPLIEAATSKAGCCPACGSCYAPVVESERVATRPGLDNQIDPTGMANRDPHRHVAVSRVTGYRATCGCSLGEPVPCRVLDPFGGSGTVGQVARALGRDYTLIELNQKYVPLIEARVKTLPKWAIPEKPKKSKKPAITLRQLTLCQ
jgi:hypothetical protein